MRPAGVAREGCQGVHAALKIEKPSFIAKRGHFMKGWNQKWNIPIVLLRHYGWVCAGFAPGTAAV